MSTQNTGSMPDRFRRAISGVGVIEPIGQRSDENGETYQVFKVYSSSSGNIYVVAPERGYCSCPDASYLTYGHTLCKHQIAVMLEHDVQLTRRAVRKVRGELLHAIEMIGQEIEEKSQEIDDLLDKQQKYEEYLNDLTDTVLKLAD